jgi:hypothetical protein
MPSWQESEAKRLETKAQIDYSIKKSFENWVNHLRGLVNAEERRLTNKDLIVDKDGFHHNP